MVLWEKMAQPPNPKKKIRMPQYMRSPRNLKYSQALATRHERKIQPPTKKIFRCITKKRSKLSQKTGFLAHFDRFFNYTFLQHPDKLHTPIFCKIKYLMLWRGRYILLVNHQCSIAVVKLNFQICSCSMQHPRNVTSFRGFLGVWALSPQNMTLFC